jgi:hypothetical protein
VPADEVAESIPAPERGGVKLSGSCAKINEPVSGEVAERLKAAVC